MAAHRASSFKALRNLQKATTSASTPAKRGLHITGVNSSPRPLEPLSKHAYAPLSLQDLRNECRKRALAPTGTKHELVDRLHVHDGLQARAFSIAMKRIVSEPFRKTSNASSPVDMAPARHFNTTRSLKAVGDSSTIDFAFLPKEFNSSLEATETAVRVPILPHVDSDEAQATLSRHDVSDAAAGGIKDSEEHVAAMKPQIVTVTETLADGAHVDLDLGAHASSMSEVADNHASELSVDAIANLAETVGKSARRLVETPDEGTVGKVWSGFLDDLLGKKNGGTKLA